MKSDVHPQSADPKVMGFIAVLSIMANVAVFAGIMKRAAAQKKNPYKNEIFVGTKDYEEAMARAK